MSDDAGTTKPDERPRPRPARPQPNYAARRMLATTVVITAAVALGVFGWRLLGGGDDDSSPADVRWNEIALVDRTTGDVIRYDSDGEPLEPVAGTGRVVSVHTRGSRLALVRASEIVITDATDDDEPVVVEIPRGSTVTPIETATTTHLLVGDPAGGNLLIVDLADGSVIDVGAAAAPTVPKLFVETVQVDALGTRFAVADAANFQTIVVGAGIDGAAFLADQPVAVGKELIATRQVVNLQADVSLVDLERRIEATVPTELPRGGVMVDDRLVMVSVDGGVFRVRKGDRDAERIGSIAIPAGSTVAWVLPTYLGERLVVGGNGFAAVVDLDGVTVFSTTFTTADEPLRPHPSWRCLPVSAESGHSLVALDAGEQLADLTGLAITSVSADGCTVVGQRGDDFELVNRDGSVALGRLRSVVVTPDGRGVIATTTTGRTALVTLADDLELDDPIELPDAPTNLAISFLRR